MKLAHLFKQQVASMLQPVTLMTEEELIQMLEVPPTIDMGDLAFPCYTFAKTWRRSPDQIATEIITAIEQPLADAHIQAQAVGAYINLTWDRAYYGTEILSSLEEQQNTELQIGTGKRIVIDMSSPNIAKPFGVGHLRSTIIGAALHRIYQAVGYEAIRVNHLGDWGTQFGKLITAYLRWGDPEQLKLNPIGESLRVYIQFHEEVEQNPRLDDEARDWFRKLEQGDAQAVELWHYFVDVSMQSLQKMYQRLGVEFDAVLGESFYNDKMPAVIAQLQRQQLLVESDGAQVVRLDEQELPPCLILKSDGTTIYPTRDLATAIYRKEIMGADQLIYVVGGEQTLHFKQVFEVLHKMGHSWATDCIHVPFGLMKVDGKKMSTRKGKVVFLEEVLDQAVERATQIIAEKSPDLPNKEQVAEQIGIGAIIFGDLKNNRQNEIDFSLKDAVTFEGETGPYLQYTYARIQSILRKVQTMNNSHHNQTTIELETNTTNREWSHVSWALLIHLSRYTHELERAATQHEPSIIARYTLETAKLFNQFYNKDRIVDAPLSVKAQRISLTMQTGLYLKRLMTLLGLQTPEQM